MMATLALARNLKAHPSVAQNLVKIQTERSYLQALLSKTIRELRDTRFDSVITAVEDEISKKNALRNTLSR
jgi:hypothetical protein